MAATFALVQFVAWFVIVTRGDVEVRGTLNVPRWSRSAVARRPVGPPHGLSTSNIFGENGANNLSDKYQVPVLGNIPLQTTIRINADQGKPIAFDSGAISDIYKSIAEKISESI